MFNDDDSLMRFARFAFLYVVLIAALPKLVLLSLWFCLPDTEFIDSVSS